jgi:hypothetical protein
MEQVRDGLSQAEISRRLALTGAPSVDGRAPVVFLKGSLSFAGTLSTIIAAISTRDGKRAVTTPASYGGNYGNEASPAWTASSATGSDNAMAAEVPGFGKRLSLHSRSASLPGKPHGRF